MNYLREEYEGLIAQYRRKLFELRKAEKKGEASSILLFIDKERDDIHKKLRKIASEIGLSSQDITLDILVSEKDLSEHGLPEFKTVRTDMAMDVITRIMVDGDKKISSPRSEKIPKNIAAFIPFGQQEAWHLFDYEEYISRQPDELERRRRVDRVVKLSEGYAHAVEIVSNHSYHNATILFGVGFPAEKLEKTLGLLYENRAEVSIDKEFFDKEQINRDFLSMIKEDLDFIIDRKPDDSETRTYLVDRLGYRLIECSRLDLDSKTLDALKRLLEGARERAEIADERERIGNEVDSEMIGWDKAEKNFPKEINLPTKGRM